MPEKDKTLSEEEKLLMAQYGITCETKMVYFYKQYRYENLTDALRYAEWDKKRTLKNTQHTTD